MQNKDEKKNLCKLSQKNSFSFIYFSPFPFFQTISENIMSILRALLPLKIKREKSTKVMIKNEAVLSHNEERERGF
jgi:hypothetical protein